MPLHKWRLEDWIWLLSLMLLGYWILSQSQPKVEPSSPSHEPEFRAGVCFMRDGLREPWEQDVDGMVAMVGYRKYLVLWRATLERGNYVPEKDGWAEDIELFDGHHHEAVCPSEWKQ
jgi:hypothetical protein